MIMARRGSLSGRLSQMKQNSGKSIKIIGWTLFLLALGFFCLQMGFLFVQAKFQVEYVDDRLFYIINILAVTCLTLAILLLLRLTKIYHIIGFSILVIFITANIMMLVSSNEKIRNITSIAPNF